MYREQILYVFLKLKFCSLSFNFVLQTMFEFILACGMRYKSKEIFFSVRAKLMCPAPSVEKFILCSVAFVQISYLYICGLISGLSVLFYQSVYPYINSTLFDYWKTSLEICPVDSSDWASPDPLVCHFFSQGNSSAPSETTLLPSSLEIFSRSYSIQL